MLWNNSLLDRSESSKPETAGRCCTAFEKHCTCGCSKTTYRTYGLLIISFYKLKSQEEVDWHELRQVGEASWSVPFLKFQLITCGWVGCKNQLLWIPYHFGKWILQIKSSFLNFDDKAHLLHEFKDWHLLAVRTMTPPACHAQSEAEWLQHIQNQYFSRQDLQIGR